MKDKMGQILSGGLWQSPYGLEAGSLGTNHRKQGVLVAELPAHRNFTIFFHKNEALFGLFRLNFCFKTTSVITEKHPDESSGQLDSGEYCT